MKRMLVASVLFALALPSCGWAQGLQRVPTCGTGTPGPGVSPGYQDASGNGCVVFSGGVALSPVVSASLEASHVFKASAGTGYSFYASNLTGGTTGFLEIFDAASAPADGAVTPLICVPFSGGVASANYQGIPPAKFSTGIVGVISSSTTCFTKTTGTLTGFLSGLVQ